MIDLQQHDEGVILPVRAQARARQTGLRGEHGGALRVSVTQAAEKGKANKAILNLLAKQLGLRGSQIQLIAGQTSPQKKFLVQQITKSQLGKRIEQALAQ